MLDLVPVEADSVVEDVDPDSLLLEMDMDIDMCCLGMFDDIIQAFLDNAKDGDLHGIIQIAFLAVDIHPDVQGRVLLYPGSVPSNCCRKAQVIQVGGAQVGHQAL